MYTIERLRSRSNDGHVVVGILLYMYSEDGDEELDGSEVPNRQLLLTGIAFFLSFKLQDLLATRSKALSLVLVSRYFSPPFPLTTI